MSALESNALNQFRGRTVAITAQISSDPSVRAAKVIGTSLAPKSYSFIASVVEVDHRYQLRIPVRVIATSQHVAGLLPGQLFEGEAKILPTRELRVADMAIIHSRIHIVTPPSAWARTLARIRLGLRSASGGADSGALIPGMVLGDTSKQTQDFKNDMRRAGLTHLVAVSGANFAIVSSFVLWGMQFLFRRINYRIAATALSLAAFITLVRPSPSVLRAAAMAAVLLAASASRQGRDPLPALGFAIAAVIVIDPFQARDPGFALSVLATAGLLLIAPKIRWQWIAPPVAAMALCLPVIVALSGYISPMSIIANVLAAPAVTPITIVGFIAALISPLSPQLAQLLIFTIKPFATFIVWIARWAAQFPVFTLKSGLYGFTAALLFILALYLGNKRYIAAILTVVLLLSWITRFPTGQWQIAQCDIGQGDSLVINLEHHRAIVIDVGPDPQLEDSCLRQLGVREIPLLILTHIHADHVGGLDGARKNRKIGATWFGNINAGAKAHIGDLTINVVWPDHGDGYTPNNSSIAALITSPNFSLFASGDIEPLVQEQLRGKLGHVDIYKVAHHGSRYQDLPLIHELSPQVALISVGKGNSYGHPAPSTIAELHKVHAKVFRTDLDGAIALRVNRHRISIRKSRSSLWR